MAAKEQAKIDAYGKHLQIGQYVILEFSQEYGYICGHYSNGIIDVRIEDPKVGDDEVRSTPVEQITIAAKDDRPKWW